jgi:hypothetical protein
MTERLLQFIWQFQYFNRQSLQTITGEPLEIVSPGEWNQHQGPDFRQARIRLNGVLWAGDVELHLQSSDWYGHHHQRDKQYAKVVLHTVYRHDKPVTDGQGNELPTLELESRISTLLLQRYSHWMLQPHYIPCQAEIATVPGITWHSWQQRLLVERLQQKTGYIGQLLEKSNNNWEQVCWQLTARYFAGPVNAEAFEQIATTLPITLLARHKGQLHQLEALLLGQAGLLEETFTDQYPLLLQQEYRFLQAKYGLQPVACRPVFLRMRPVNFPTVRLAQLAMLLYQPVHLFAQLIEATTVQQLSDLLRVTAGAFWDTHFRLQEGSAHQPKRTGGQLVDTLLINVAVPLLFAYGRQVAETKYADRALVWLEEIRAEKNNITDAFVQLQVENRNAFASQALLQLKKHYCDEKRCLECAIGNTILKRSV